MREELNIEQMQQLGQRLSPRQVMYVRLLEMSGPELEEEVYRQLDDNPALEATENNETEDISPETGSESEETAEDYADGLLSDTEDDPADRLRQNYSQREDYDIFSSAYGADEPDMYAYLESQLNVEDLPPDIIALAKYIIGNIDEDGYLTRTPAEMADDIAFASDAVLSQNGEIPVEKVREAYNAVRNLDPAGIGAIDLRDCMLLQLDRMPKSKPGLATAKEIVKDYFDLLSKKHYDRLQVLLGIKDSSKLTTALKLIQKLNPKPASAIAPSQKEVRAATITPDVLVEILPDNRFSVSLLSNLPSLQIESTFCADNEPESGKATGAVADRHKAALEFIRSKRESAESLISALKQRTATIIAVVEAIVKIQSDFFRTGDKSRLKPMILKDISAMTGIDLSVISRATAGKYVATQTGTYPLKMFFSEAPTENADTSKHTILDDLKTIIDNEDKHHPFSDEALRSKMAERGHDIARRTITKYRESMGIPVGRLRKEI